MHDILQYEEKLIKTRLELNDLIEKYSNNKENIDKAIIENKIEYLTKELDYLNNQLNLLKLSVENETENNNTYSADKPPVNHNLIILPGTVLHHSLIILRGRFILIHLSLLLQALALTMVLEKIQLKISIILNYSWANL